MKTVARLVLLSLVMVIATPAYSKSDLQAIQIFTCEFNDDATVEQVMALTGTWLKAARETAGGENMNAYIRFPIAEGDTFDGDFKFVITTPTFAEWGAFTDAYHDSAVSKVDDDLDELVDCGEATIWEGLQIK